MCFIIMYTFLFTADDKKKNNHSNFFHNCSLIRRSQQNKTHKNLRFDQELNPDCLFNIQAT